MFNVNTLTWVNSVALPSIGATTAQKNVATLNWGINGSTTMLGIGATVKPVLTGSVLVLIEFNLGSAQGSAINTFQLAYGTGTAPVNGAAATGTTAGYSQQVTTLATIVNIEGNMSQFVTGLTTNTTYWFDLQTTSNIALANAATNISVIIFEVPY